MNLREYQTFAIGKLRGAMSTGLRHLILQASCGAGKTIISAEIAKLAIEKGKKVLFLVNRRDLVKQTVEKYSQYGLGNDIGIILAGEEHSLEKPIQCGSLQTYGRRIKLNEHELNPWFHKADLIIYDECHSANAPTYRKIIEYYNDKYILGLSATPMGAGGAGLGDIFQKIIECVPMAELIENKFLVPAVHYAPSRPDLSGVGIVAGDYNKKQLGERVDKPKLIGDLLSNWLRIAGDRKTIIFATNVKHSKHIRDEFIENGIKISHIDAHTNDDDRTQIYSDFEKGDLQVITNVGVACEGSDLPIASAICIAKPTRVLSRWLQMAGRGARPYPGKKDFLLLDFSGCIDQHGYVDDPVEWDLDAKKPAAKKKIIRKKEKTIIICDMCSCAFTGKRCPMCGFEIKDYGKRIEAAEAELVKVKGEKQHKATTEEKRRFYGQLEYERRSKGYAPGWSAHKFRERMGCWPNHYKDQGPIEPDDAFRNYMTHLRIKWVKSKQKRDERQQALL